MDRRAKKNRPTGRIRQRPEMAAKAADEKSAVVFGGKDWLFAAGLFVVLLLVYQPALQGGLLWDDNEHVTRADLRSWHGLYRIWFDVGATLQYYPLLHSAFWLEHRLWGDATSGYHLIKIVEHTLAAALVLAVLRRLALPGALLAAAIFALHPLQVESVAWIAEQKNTLSAVFYLGAALFYLRFDETGRPACYAAAAGMFLLALLTKTVTATLPGAMLVIFWWQRGRLSWKRDVLPLVPLFALGAAFGLITAWWELKHNQCTGPAFAFTFAQRLLIAGRTAWWCCGKLLWPANLTFIYPRWQLDAAAWWQWLYPAGAAALIVALWAVRRRTRGPLAAILYFGGTLFPVLGFFNLYTYRYTFVADHYQYLACLGIIVLFSAAAAMVLRGLRGGQRMAGQAACIGLLIVLAGLSYRQTQMYADMETLYRTTIERNPDCWMAYNNLGSLLSERKQVDAAIDSYQKALELNSDLVETRFDLANALAGRGKLEAAIREYRRALEIKSDDPKVHCNLGNALLDHGEIDEAIREYRRAAEIKPDAKTCCNLANALAQQGETEAAITEYRKALALDDRYADACNNLAGVYFLQGRFDEAVVCLQNVLELKPGDAGTARNLALAIANRDALVKDAAQRREAARLRPDDAALLNGLAWTLATNANASVRNEAEAVELAQRAVKLGDGNNPAMLDTLAAAYAEAGRFADAVATAEQAVKLAAGDKTLAAQISKRLESYKRQQPYREMPEHVKVTFPHR